MLIDLHPVVLFEVHWVLFKDNLDLAVVGDFKYNQARELRADGFYVKKFFLLGISL